MEKSISEKINKKILKKAVKKSPKNTDQLLKLLRKNMKNLNIKMPSFSSLLLSYYKLTKTGKLKRNYNLEKLLKKRKIRSLSGIVTITVSTKYFPCPGKCIYCPIEKGIPKSYLSNEPAVMRAILNRFNPFNQIKARLKSLKLTGHPTDKIELIIIGGTWSALPKKYQSWFIKRCYDALNQKNAKNLYKAKKLNEKTKHRLIGLTIETRPDFINKKEIERLRNFGVTRVEIGVQNIYNDVLIKNLRGHNRKTIIETTKILKDAGLKVNYHIMPNLYGSNLKKDFLMFKELFSNPNFQPDMLKIYPCVVLKNSKLYQLYKEGKYKPYSTSILKKFLKKIKKEIIPYYVRIMRLIRDIPSNSIICGNKVSNLRQIIATESKKENWQCKCIRCREIKEKEIPKKIKLFRYDYSASKGKEIFLSFEDSKRKHLLAFLRLRIPSQIFKKEKHFIKTLNNSAIIREVHTYGKTIPIGAKNKKAVQHKGLGKRLIKEAERIAKKEFKLKKIAVISGVGVREYYRKLGYRLKNEYMIKKLV